MSPRTRHREGDPHWEGRCGACRCVCAAWIHTDWTVLLLRGGVRRPERGIAGSSGAAASFFEGAMDHCHRLADDASRAAEDELAESSGRSALLLSSRHLHSVQYLSKTLTTS